MSTIDSESNELLAREVVIGATPATDLTNLLLAGPLPVGRAAAIGVEIAQALSALHRSGAARGALTPRDVLLDATGSAYLAPVPHDARAGAVAAYAAPERGEPTASAAAGDMYSLGVMLYEMVVGETPVPNWDMAVVEETHRKELPPLPSASAPLVPRAYDDLVLQLLDAHAVARPNADEAASVLRRFAIRSAAPRAWYRLRTSEPVHERNPWPIVAAVLAGILMIALIGWLVWRDNGADKQVVPSVVGASSAEASARLRNAGFEVAIVEAPNNGIPLGFVVDQSPIGGQDLASHSTVVVTVSTGPAVAPIVPGPPPIIVQPPAVSSSSSTATTSTSTTTTTTSTARP